MLAFIVLLNAVRWSDVPSHHEPHKPPFIRKKAFHDLRLLGASESRLSRQVSRLQSCRPGLRRAVLLKVNTTNPNPYLEMRKIPSIRPIRIIPRTPRRHQSATLSKPRHAITAVYTAYRKCRHSISKSQEQKRRERKQPNEQQRTQLDNEYSAEDFPAAKRPRQYISGRTWTSKRLFPRGA